MADVVLSTGDSDTQTPQWEFPGSGHDAHYRPAASTWGRGVAWGLGPGPRLLGEGLAWVGQEARLSPGALGNLLDRETEADS